MKMREVALLVAVLCVLPCGATVAGTDSAAETVDLSQSSGQSSVCVQVSIAGEAAPDFDCLNRELGDQARAAQHFGNIPPADATTAAVKLGGFNQAALSQQYGKNWGSSLAPYRPPAPVYPGALTGR